jgi:hypothetical protein
MGQAVFLPIMAAMSVGSAAIGGVESYEAGQAQAASLEEEKKQVASQTRSKQIQNLERVNQTLGNQMVIGSASGYDLSSTSFNAVSADTMNKYEQDQNADLLSASYQNDAINQQIDNAKSSGDMGLASGFLSAGGAMANLYGNNLFAGASGGSSGGVDMSQFNKAMKPLPSIDLNYQEASRTPFWGM